MAQITAGFEGIPAGQSAVDVEILVADDASTDDTPAVVTGIAQKSPVPIKLLSSTERRGPAHARNQAIESAGGELVIAPWRKCGSRE